MIEKTLFGKLSDGREVNIYLLRNNSGTQVSIINYGAIVTSLYVKNKDGVFEDVVLGYDTIEGYENDKNFIGAIVGRYGNRISKGKFSLDSIEYQLTINDGKNHLHGGATGFYKSLWDAEEFESKEGTALKLIYVSPDGEEGYPGTVTITVVYTLTNHNELKIEYTGETDKATILNPTHHSYFNLSGDFTKTILDDKIKINANRFTSVDETLIPTGELRNVEGTPMDFRSFRKIGEGINEDYEQLKFGKGYDHNWVLNEFNYQVKTAAIIYNSYSGRVMEVLTDQPGIQFYSGNFLDGSITGKNGIKYKHRTALCLETQGFPDSPNKSEFPSVILQPDKLYKQITVYKFSVK